MKLVKLCFLLFIFCSCKREIVVEENKISDDLIYLQNKNKPFSGKYKVVYNNTNLPKAVFSYKNGEVKGIATAFYKNGNKKWEGEYKNGMLEGKWIFWNENGTIKYELFFNIDTINSNS